MGKIILLFFVCCGVCGQSFDVPIAVFTTDDGGIGNYLYYAPLMDSNGIKTTFYISPQIIDSGGRNGFPSMSWQQVCDLYKRGFDIQSHSFAHAHMIKLSESELADDFRKCDSAFIAHKIPRACHFAYPFGDSNELVKRITSKYMLSARTINRGLNTPGVNRYMLHDIRLDMAKGDIKSLRAIESWVDEAVRSKACILFDGHHVLPDEEMSPKKTHTIQYSYLREIVLYCKNKNMKFMTVSEFVRGYL